ncbi:MAG TPA: DUF5916 domain-containing protein [Candidatus Polarisedimenticolaceae bacterium]|nr:DUF5916 domain-containing protein [Candidatus Polarisedimenticolaceae bacterium]
MLGGRRLIPGVVAALSIGLAVGQEPVPSPTPAPSAYKPPPITIARATGPIEVDGDISDAAWKDAVPIEEWWETNPGDNIPAKVRNVGRVAYDDKYLYVALEFDDPDPKKIRAPYADRDNVDSTTDYGGIILDADNDRKTAILFLANPRGIQYDSMNSDTNGSEDNAPDWFWDSAGKITDKGWTLEIRIPFSSLRYTKDKVQTWGMMLYRNYPRDRRYQMFTVKLPKDSSCFICNEQDLQGMTDLPTGGNWVIAPYGVAHQESTPRDGTLGADLVNPAPDYDAGVDAKWAPNASTTLDATYNPDFSQIESDVAQISANERFALFYPEKRPFFLERVDLLATPIQAVYTRTITDPEWGARATGQAGNTSYTGLVTKDEGGGTVIIPGPNGSDFGDQDFASYVGIGRVRQDFGQSFASALLTDREIVGGGYNRVFGPDFQWRPKPSETLTGQILFSDTITPNAASLDPAKTYPTEWNARRLQSHAADIWYQHQDKHWDGYGEYRDFGDDFRADVGFVPQAGFREQYVEGGYTRRPTKGFVSRQRFFVQGDYVQDRDRELLDRFWGVGTGIDGLANSFMQFRFIDEDVRAIDALSPTGESQVLPRQRVTWVLQASPWSWLTRVSTDGAYYLKDVDFVRARSGHGGTVNFNATLRPTDHIQIDLLANRRWLDVEVGEDEPRLFTAQVQRIKAVYTFNRRSFVRLIGQRETNRRDPAVFFAPDPAPPLDQFAAKIENIDWSALFAYKLNWQSVLYFGVSDSSEYSSDTTDMEHAGRSIFLKVSYAFQH